MSPLLHAPIVPTLARLAAPGIALALFQTAVSVADTYFVGRLGTESLAGLALVFPMVMLLQMTSAGAMGGGVSSAVARALGAGKQDAARELVVHAVVIAMGATGSVSRLLLPLAGSLLTYTNLTPSLGQIPLDRLIDDLRFYYPAYDTDIAKRLRRTARHGSSKMG